MKGDRGSTPLSWRLVSAFSLPAALLAGVGAARSLSARAALALGGATFITYVLPLARASRRAPLGGLAPGGLPAGESLPTVSVVIAARDEVAVLPNIIRDIAGQDHRDRDGRPRFELIVVDDRSTDGTGAVARATAVAGGIGPVTRVLRRGPPESAGVDAIRAANLADGKGAALTMAQPGTCRGEIVCILDAEARIAPDYLRRAASYFVRGVEALSTRQRMPVGGMRGFAGLLARAQDDEQTTDAEIQAGRWAANGCSEFRGNGMIMRRDRLAEVGGWRAETVCEDLDVASRLAATHGIRVAWALDTVAWSEPVLSARVLWRQRCRWAEGIVRRQLALTWPLLRSPKLGWKAKLDYLTYTSQTVAPISLLGAVLGGFVFRRWRAALSLLGVYLAAGSVLSADALRWSPDAHGRVDGWPRRLIRGFAVTLFSAHWLLAFPVGWGRVAFSRGPIRFAKTTHIGTPGDPRPAPPVEGLPAIPEEHAVMGAEEPGRGAPARPLTLGRHADSSNGRGRLEDGIEPARELLAR